MTVDNQLNFIAFNIWRLSIGWIFFIDIYMLDIDIGQSYATRLLRLVDTSSVNKDDVLGAEDSSLGASAAAAARSFFGKAATVSKSSSSKTTVFTLGNYNKNKLSKLTFNWSLFEDSQRFF